MPVYMPAHSVKSARIEKIYREGIKRCLKTYRSGRGGAMVNYIGVHDFGRVSEGKGW